MEFCALFRCSLAFTLHWGYFNLMERERTLPQWKITFNPFFFFSFTIAMNLGSFLLQLHSPPIPEASEPCSRQQVNKLIRCCFDQRRRKREKAERNYTAHPSLVSYFASPLSQGRLLFTTSPQIF